jgi:hypothetical protein
MIISRSVLLRMKNVSDNSCRENENTHVMFNIFFFFFENRAVYDITCKNTVQTGRPHMTIWRTAYWIPKATNTHQECVIFIFFPTAKMLAWTSLNVTLHVHCLTLVFLGSSSAPTPTFPDTIKSWTQELVLKIVKNTVEVLHSVTHDISVAAEWGWREDAFARVLHESAKMIEQGDYIATDGDCSSNSSENTWNGERCGSAVITE